MDEGIFNNHNSLLDEEISIFEKEYNIEFLKGYKCFLINYSKRYINADYRFPIIDKFIITPADGFESIGFLCVDSFLNESKKYILNYGKANLPVGASISGDLLCIGMQGKRYGKIYYWYHEDESEGREYYLVAESFSKFMLSFEKNGII